LSRYALPQVQPAQPTIEGDQQFVGIQMTLDRDKLTNGYIARGENNRMKRGICAPRGGTIIPTFANVYPLNTIYGSGLFSNPNGDEHILVAIGQPSIILAIKAGSYPTIIGEPIDPPFVPGMEFVQHFDKLLLHRPDGGNTLEWDGDLSHPFSPISKSNPGDTSTVLMPNPAWSVNFGNRAIFPTGPDTIGVSDIDDYTSYDPILMDFRINTGTADRVVGAYPFAQNNLIVGKTRGMDVLTNFVGDLSLAAMEVLTNEIGICARRSGRMVGADFFYLSGDHFGVYRISEVIQSRLQSEPVPVSDAIEPLMKRINWKYAGNAVANVHDIFYGLAVPMDQSKVNNAVLIHNTVTKEWESIHLWDPASGMQIDNLIVTDYYGQLVTYAIGGPPGYQSIYAFGIGIDDQMAINTDNTRQRYWIDHIIETRGFATLGWNAATKRDFKRVEIAVATLMPSVTVTEITEKAKDERILNSTPITRNPAKYHLFSKADYVADNTNQDFEAPMRQDYSLDLTNTDFDLTDPGVQLEIKQNDTLRFSTKARGRWVSYRIENKQGVCETQALLAESTGTQRETRKAA
jgi:hypothetical protein